MFAGSAVGADPAPNVHPPESTGKPGSIAEPPEDAEDVVLPVTFLGHPRRPPPVCEPPAPVWPPPGTPPGTMPPTMPPTPPGTMPPTGAPSDALARSPEAGTLAAATFNPNMFGDQFSTTGRGSLVRRVFLTIERNGAVSPDEYARYLGVVNTRQYQPHRDFPGDFPAQVTVERHILGVGSPVFTAVNPVAANPGTRPVNPLLENAQVTAVLQTLVPHGSVTYIGGAATEMTDPNTLFTPHRIDVVYDLNQVGLGLALPPDGGMVGRTKLSDDNNPLPRDRVILGYDYFANPLLAAGLDVHRFALGLEKTFWDQQASFEFRFPFASTLDNVAGAGGVSARGIEYGNLFTAFKALLSSSEDLHTSAGFAVAFPTGADGVLMAFDGREFVRVKNRSVLVQPFVAALYTPGERFFAQAWLQGSFDLTGNPVYTDFDGTGLKKTGRLMDQARAAVDMQVGYWVYRRSGGDGLRGLAPFFELHYNTTVTDSDTVAAPPRTTIGVADRRFDEVNASVGLTALFGNNLMIMAGLVVPLRDGDNRFFDYQFGVRANWFYGPTAAARELADATGGRPEALPGNTIGPGYPAGPAPAMGLLSGGPAFGGLGGNPAPAFFGDLIGLTTRTVRGARFAELPVVPTYNAMKPTDIDGPHLADRYYFAFNQYSDVSAAVNPGAPSLRLNREIVGFETVFADRFGFGLRVPFAQLNGPDDVDTRVVGDITAVFKYAIVGDPCSGEACTMGINLTVPIGSRPGSDLIDGSIPRGFFAQPWIGAVWTSGDAFVQGVSSIVLPTQPEYPVAWFNSLGAGYWIYGNGSDSLVHGIAPVVELHLNTPLNNGATEIPFVLREQLTVTTGVWVQFPRLAFGGAVSIPVTGPRPYDVGGILTASYQF
jgi:hypothetical protein